MSVENSQGQWVSRTEKDIESGLVIEGMTVVERDVLGRETEIVYSDGTTEEKSYTCCGVEWEKARDGTETFYTYDELKRVVSESVNGLTTLYTYDGSGRVLTVTRRGSGGSDIVVETNTYDAAGRLASRKNALNETTTFAESTNGSGQKVRTTTLPGGGTRVEVTHRDGQPLTISGTATHPLKYTYGVDGGESWRKEIRVGSGGSESEWTKTVWNAAGRTVRIEYPNSSQDTMYYNNLGQLIRQSDGDGVSRLFDYNAQGEQVETAIDADGSGALSAGDRRMRTTRSVASGPPFANSG